MKRRGESQFPGHPRCRGRTTYWSTPGRVDPRDKNWRRQSAEAIHEYAQSLRARASPQDGPRTAGVLMLADIASGVLILPTVAIIGVISSVSLRW